jgi:uncharacterized membrane protein
MRFLSAIFFIFSLPVIVFLGAILFGGVSSFTIKQGLLTSNAYTIVSDQLGKQLDATSEEGTDVTVNTVIKAAKNRITSTYLQAKTEKVIDDTVLWMNGKVSIPPTLSFSEIKDDIDAQNPDLLPTLLKTMEEAKQQAQNAQQENPGNSGQSLEYNSIGSFIENGFTVPLGKSLTILKQTRNQLFIAFMVLLILSLISLVFMVLFSHPMKKKLTYVGIVFLIAATYGYMFTFGSHITTAVLVAIIKSQSNQAVVYIAPILINLFTAFIKKYMEYQVLTSMSLAAIGIVLFILSMIVKGDGKTVSVQNKPVKKTPKKSK